MSSLDRSTSAGSRRYGDTAIYCCLAPTSNPVTVCPTSVEPLPQDRIHPARLRRTSDRPIVICYMKQAVQGRHDASEPLPRHCTLNTVRFTRPVASHWLLRIPARWNYLADKPPVELRHDDPGERRRPAGDAKERHLYMRGALRVGYVDFPRWPFSRPAECGKPREGLSFSDGCAGSPESQLFSLLRQEAYDMVPL